MPILTGKTYAQLRSMMLPGDVIAFGGDHWMSRIVKQTTQSPISHVGIIASAAAAGAEPMVAESTVQLSPGHDGHDANNGQDTLGVRVAPCDTIVQHYAGDAWWLPLGTTTRAAFDSAGFQTYLAQIAGRLFDPLGGGGVLLRRPLRRMIALGLIDPTADDLTFLFCSELVAGALRAADAVASTIEPSDVTPADLCSWAIYAADAWQLKGATANIPTFNTSQPSSGGGRALRSHILRERVRQKLAHVPQIAAELKGMVDGAKG